MKLPTTTRAIAALKLPAQGQVDYADTKIGGLMLRISSTDVWTWFLRHRIDGQQHRVKLGHFPALDLGAARDAATAARVNGAKSERAVSAARRIEEAMKPVDHATITFDALADVFLAESTRKDGTPKDAVTIRNQRNALVKARAKFGSWPAVAVKKSHVREFLKTIPAPQARTLARGTIAAMYQFAIKHYDDSFSFNPASAKMVDTPRCAPRDRVQEPGEIAELRQAIEGGTVFSAAVGDALDFLQSTGQRPDEVADLRRDEIIGLGTANVEVVKPASRMKMRKEHRYPLVGRALAIVERRLAAGCGERIFGIRRETMSEALKRFTGGKAAGSYTPHDIRRTVGTGLAEIGVAWNVGEAILAHSAPGVHGRYVKAKYKVSAREGLLRWDAALEEICTDNVIRLPRAA